MRFTTVIGSRLILLLAISVLTVIFLAMFFLAALPFPFQFLNPQFLLMQFAPDSILAEKIPFQRRRADSGITRAVAAFAKAALRGAVSEDAFFPTGAVSLPIGTDAIFGTGLSVFSQPFGRVTC